MQTEYKGGRSTMEPFDDMEALKAAMAERVMHPDVVSVTAHKVGSTMKQGGRMYELNALGQWCRVGKRRKA